MGAASRQIYPPPVGETFLVCRTRLDVVLKFSPGLPITGDDVSKCARHKRKEPQMNTDQCKWERPSKARPRRGEVGIENMQSEAIQSQRTVPAEVRRRKRSRLMGSLQAQTRRRAMRMNRRAIAGMVGVVVSLAGWVNAKDVTVDASG